ncbi:MAG TPA: protein translocase subunit SecF [Thermoleophilia bacterium]|nr:protein translocase subunit SecF [Thermoleophilia bacterium]
MKFFRGIYSFDYMGHKVWWFVISGIIILAGLASLFIRGGGNPVQGLNYGLEFKEGTRVTVVFEQSPSLADVRQVVSQAGYSDAQIQQSGNVANSGNAGFQIQTQVLSSDQQVALKQALDSKFKIAARSGSWNLETVSASFGRQVISSSLKAVALALLLILIYVTFRFQWKFAVGAISAEIHDLLIVVGVYSLTGREVTTATIAAVLTILGYSLYDTVIVYDRIRENEPRFNRIPYGDMVNLSIWETLTRSINTSLITLLPVVCLLLFGGSTLKDFAFALLVGILSGAYSSIFIASPVLTLLKEREPQYKKLRAQARADQA